MFAVRFGNTHTRCNVYSCNFPSIKEGIVIYNSLLYSNTPLFQKIYKLHIGELNFHILVYVTKRRELNHFKFHFREFAIKKERQKETWKGGGGATMCHNIFVSRVGLVSKCVDQGDIQPGSK